MPRTKKITPAPVDHRQLVFWKDFVKQNPHLGTETAWEWLLRSREENGLTAHNAVVVWKGKLFVNPPGFDAYLTAQNEMQEQRA